MDTAQYAKLMAMMLDVPIHKSPNNRGIIEALHVIFTLFSEFRENQHFQQQQNNQEQPNQQFEVIN